MTLCRRVVWAVAAALAAAAAAGCVGLETGNGEQPATVTVGLGLTATETDGDASPLAADADGVPFTIHSATASVAWIDLTLPAGADCGDIAGTTPAGQPQDIRWTLGCATPSKLRFRGPWAVDLVTGAFSPPLDPASVPAGVYTAAEVRLLPADPGDGVVAAGDPLAGMTLTASGEFLLAGAPTPFAMALKFTDSALFTLPDGTTFGAGLHHDLRLLLDVTAWFADLPIADCAAKGDLSLEGPTVALGEGKGKCQGLEQALTAAIPKTTRAEARQNEP
jgi:hypothetical protein